MLPLRGRPSTSSAPLGYSHSGGKGGAMDKNRCMVCAREGAFEGGICDMCKAIIRGEALEGQHQIRKEADKSLHKEGTEIERKRGG
jgi:hypothetical protein